MDNGQQPPQQQNPAQQPPVQQQQQMPPQNQPMHPQQQALPQDNPMLNAVMGFGLSNQDVKNGDDMQALLRELGINDPQGNPTQQQAPPAQGAPPQQNPAQQQQNPNQQVPPDQQQQQQNSDQWGNPVGPNPIGADGKPVPGFESPILSGMNTPDSQAQISSEADLLASVNKKYGLNLQNIQEISKFLDSVDKWRKDSTQFSDAKTQAEQYEQLLNELPSDVFKSIQAFYSGQDWREPLKNINTGLDFKKDATQQDIVTLVNSFDENGKKWTLEELNDPENVAANYAKQSAIKSFNQKKTEYEYERTTVSDQVKRQQQAYASSVSSSVESLKNTLPKLDQATENQLTEILNGGNLNTLFLNNDGTVKKEAAERLLYALHGKETLEEMRKRAMAEGKTQATQQQMQQMPAQPPINQGGQPQGQIQLPPEVARAFSGLEQKSPYNE